MPRPSSTTAVADRLESKALAPTKRGPTILDLIERQKPEIERALPQTGITPERFTRLVMTELRKNEALTKCSPESLLGAMMMTAQLGLEPGPLGHAYFVPFNSQVQFILGYRGMIALAARAGITISAYVIRKNDLFTFDYGSGKVQHSYKLTQARGESVGVWAKAVMPNGQENILVMTKEEVYAHRKRSRSAQSGPWVTDEEAMWKKTAIRVLCSQVPLSAEGQRAIAADESTVSSWSEAETVIDYVEPVETVEVQATEEANV